MLKILNFNNNKLYDGNSEWEQGCVFEHINHLPIREKATLWNKCFPHIPIELNNTDEDIEHLFNTFTDNYFHEFIPLVAEYLSF